MKTVSEIVEALAAPFPPEQVDWRVGSTNKKKFDAGQAKERKGQVLCYIDARDVMGRLDVVAGPDNWQDRYEVIGSRTFCYLSIKLAGEWITKADAAGDTDVESEKGAVSDAFKRAAVKWSIGRYLYSIDAPWIVLDEYWGIPREAHANLRALLERKAGNAPKPAPVVPGRVPASPMQDPHYKIAFGKLAECETLDELRNVWRFLLPNIRDWSPELKRSIEDHKNAMKERLSNGVKEAAE